MSYMYAFCTNQEPSSHHTAHGYTRNKCLTGHCNNDTDCGENAQCITREVPPPDGSGDPPTIMQCECSEGFFDFPPEKTAKEDGCLGECNDLGQTDQCPGNTECVESSSGFGECECPVGTEGEPECPVITTVTTTLPTTTTTTTTENPVRRRVLPILLSSVSLVPLLLILPAFASLG
ncbi:uncharacterized protein LOC133203385 [Saccostrea echinata]|uniref:uncharacterized protein LOC133203385 n=1 Tax=Saccostrea echinata TaxID=191078 RepID=UPI002A7EBDF9|nr:uncharacterized protein LOC133203385 [Saccostrea echinata]